MANEARGGAGVRGKRATEEEKGAYLLNLVLTMRNEMRLSRLARRDFSRRDLCSMQCEAALPVLFLENACCSSGGKSTGPTAADC